MKLIKFSDRIYYYPYDDDRDRPVLGYIKGDKFSVAIEAGHSQAHIDEFYTELKKNEMPLPEVTILTHWHWDHSFAMAYVHGKTVAHVNTNKHLNKVRKEMPGFQEELMKSNPWVAEEFKTGEKMNVVLADVTFEDNYDINAGGIHIHAFHVVSPHTDDSVFIYIPEEKVLFTGDVQNGSVTDLYNPDKELLAQTMTVIERTEAETIISGHWPVTSKEQFLETQCTK